VQVVRTSWFGEAIWFFFRSDIGTNTMVRIHEQSGFYLQNRNAQRNREGQAQNPGNGITRSSRSSV